MRLPIGYDNFSDLILKKLDFVDKTLFIKEVLDNIDIQVSVITRPRRFGKTLNLSMLQYFLAPEAYGQTTSHLFDGLKIAELGDKYMHHQGKYPVIFVTFKEIKEKDFSMTYAAICHRIGQLYGDHQYLLLSEKLGDYEKKVFLSVLEKKADLATIGASLHDLSRYIFKHTGIKPWILIDEYDTPIQAGYLNGYYDSIIGLMRNIFGTALKTNPYLDRGVITGILRVSKESLFSGANNIKVYSLFNTGYSEHFGFTEAEVDELLKKSNLSNASSHIRAWYNGYQIGKTTIYNPWSLANCISEKGVLRPYWVNTSSNDLVRELLAYGDETLKKDLETIIQGETITAFIEESMVFGDLKKNRSAIWSLLLFCGYLKTIHTELKEDQLQCELAVPNQEVMALYRGIVKGWLSDPLGSQGYLEFLLSLTEGRADEFTDRLQKYLLQTISVFDAAKEPEKFYHGFVLGMMVSLGDTHEVKSNRESGYGRYDVMLIPKDPEQLGVILEFKTVREKKPDLKKAAEEALQQIKTRSYETSLRQKGIKRILKMGLAFHGKRVQTFSELTETAQLNELQKV